MADNSTSDTTTGRQDRKSNANNPSRADYHAFVLGMASFKCSQAFFNVF